MFNQALLVGNLGKDPEVKTLPNGDKVANFTIATSETWKDKQGQKQERTVWHNIVCWRGLAEVVEKYVKKGDRVLVTGRIDNRSYDKQDGTKGYISEIVVDNLRMLGGKRGEGESAGADSKTRAELPPGVPPEDDLPF